MVKRRRYLTAKPEPPPGYMWWKDRWVGPVATIDHVRRTASYRMQERLVADNWRYDPTYNIFKPSRRKI